MALATRLKKARLQQNKTQQQLAEEVGVKQQAIQRIEAGKVNSTSYLVHIAKALKISSDWLAFGPNDEPVPIGIQERAAQYSKGFPSVPLFAWSEVNPLLNIADSDDKRKRMPCFLPVGERAFAVQLASLDDSMIAFDGKISFQSHDIIIVDPAKIPKNGSFVLATMPRVVLRKYVSEVSTSNGDYLAALNSKYKSIACNAQVKIYGTIVEKVTLFS